MMIGIEEIFKKSQDATLHTSKEIKLKTWIKWIFFFVFRKRQVTKIDLSKNRELKWNHLYRRNRRVSNEPQ